MCWMAPGPSMPAISKVSPAAMRTKGFTFPALAQVPGGILGRAVLQLAHYGARALGPIEVFRADGPETAFDSRNRLLILFIMPLYIFQKSHFIYDIGFIFLDRIIVEEICFINIFL